MSLLLYAHKNGIPQTVAAAVEDYPVSFGEAKVNVGSVFNTQAGEFVLPDGVFEAHLTLNIVNPQDGGKYNAFFVKEGIQQIGIDPRRMSGGADTLGVSTTVVLFGDGVSKFKPCFQHSNDSGTKQIDGQESATWLSIIKLSDTVVEDLLKHSTTGPLTGPVSAGTFTYIDRHIKLEPGRVVERLGNYSETSATFPLKIVKSVSAGVVDVVIDASNVHDGKGWRDVSITPWTVPNDGKDYYVGAYTTGLNMMMFDGWPRAYAASNITGTGVSVTEETPATGRYVIGIRASYAS